MGTQVQNIPNFSTDFFSIGLDFFKYHKCYKFSIEIQYTVSVEEDWKDQVNQKVVCLHSCLNMKQIPNEPYMMQAGLEALPGLFSAGHMF